MMSKSYFITLNERNIVKEHSRTTRECDSLRYIEEEGKSPFEHHEDV